MPYHLQSNRFFKCQQVTWRVQEYFFTSQITQILKKLDFIRLKLHRVTQSFPLWDIWYNLCWPLDIICRITCCFLDSVLIKDNTDTFPGIKQSLCFCFIVECFSFLQNNSCLVVTLSLRKSYKDYVCYVISLLFYHSASQVVFKVKNNFKSSLC